MNRRILLIANPGAAAGRGLLKWEQLLARFEERRIEVDHVLTESPRHAVTLAQNAAGKYDAVAAVGGDGTVNEVGSGLLLAGATETALAVVPFGTGNDVARLAGIRTVEQALEALVHGVVRPMDAIEIHCADQNGETRRFGLLYAAVGFAGELLKRTTPMIKRLFGPRYCYSVGFFRALLSFRSPMLHVRCDEQEFSGKMFLVSAGNAEIVGAGTMRLSPGARIDDGKLNVNVVAELGRLETARWFPRLLKGEHIHHPRVRYLTASSVRIESDPKIEIQVDGELFGQTPATLQVRPKAVKLLSLGQQS